MVVQHKIASCEGSMSGIVRGLQHLDTEHRTSLNTYTQQHGSLYKQRTLHVCQVGVVPPQEISPLLCRCGAVGRSSAGRRWH